MSDTAEFIKPRSFGEYDAKIAYMREHHKGISWGAVLYRNDVYIGDVHNLGDGGCNDYFFVKPDERKLFEQFVKDNYSSEVVEPQAEFVECLIERHDELE